MGRTRVAQPEDILAEEQSHDVQPPRPCPALAHPAPVPIGVQQPLAGAGPSSANPSQMPQKPITTPHPLHHFTGGLPGPSQYPQAPPLLHALHSNPASPSGFPYSVASHPHLPLGPYGMAAPQHWGGPYAQFPMAAHNHFHFPPGFFPTK